MLLTKRWIKFFDFKSFNYAYLINTSYGLKSRPYSPIPYKRVYIFDYSETLFPLYHSTAIITIGAQVSYQRQNDLAFFANLSKHVQIFLASVGSWYKLSGHLWCEAMDRKKIYDALFKTNSKGEHKFSQLTPIGKRILYIKINLA